ncbi:molybdopterin molybdotransferase MoeA [Pseudonocardia oceani]|uniref:Molybdopterin molybdenumtransferase n=1 Tax=Pseudonocardia oceani TaxID=2792013 RepID=A0ABS6U1Z4_9PSEU|nr:molybdopterin molybdotransferase MoeA [Pseudonocardia oceani]
MRDVAAHAARAAALVAPVGSETLPLAACAGRRLAADVHAVDDLPAFDNSAMDGYALRIGDLGPDGLPVTAHVPAGSVPAPLAPGTAQRVMTGAPLPEGADTIIPVELTDDGREHVRVLAPVTAGRHIRRRGDDIRTGDVVLRSGTALGPAQLAAAAGCGLAVLPVHRRLRVAVLSAGSELVGAGGRRGAGQTHDSNGVLLVAALRAAGADAEQLPIVPDSPAELAALLERHLDGIDLLVTSGGISAGDHEVVRDVLGPAGVEFGPVALRPGGAQGLGTHRGVPVITLPGNPVACWVGFELFVRPAVRAASKLPQDRVRRAARATVAFRASPGRHTVVPAVLDEQTGEVAPVPSAGSHSLRALAGANCLVELDGTGAAAGEQVTILPTS